MGQSAIDDSFRYCFFKQKGFFYLNIVFKKDNPFWQLIFECDQSPIAMNTLLAMAKNSVDDTVVLYIKIKQSSKLHQSDCLSELFPDDQLDEFGEVSKADLIIDSNHYLRYETIINVLEENFFSEEQMIFIGLKSNKNYQHRVSHKCKASSSSCIVRGSLFRGFV